MRFITALLTASLLATPVIAQNQLPSIIGPSGRLTSSPQALINPNGGSSCVYGASGCPGLLVSDPNDAPYSRSVTITPGGASVSATRALAADCSGVGTLTVVMSGGGTLSWSVGLGHNLMPYSATAISNAGSATCSIFGLY